MHLPARLPEKFDQTSRGDPCVTPETKSGLTQNNPLLPKMKNSNFLSWVQIWAYPEHPANVKTLTFVPELRSELTQNPPGRWKTLNFLSWVQIWAYPEHPPPRGSWSMWRLYPPRIPSSLIFAGIMLNQWALTEQKRYEHLEHLENHPFLMLRIILETYLRLDYWTKKCDVNNTWPFQNRQILWKAMKWVTV